MIVINRRFSVMLNNFYKMNMVKYFYEIFNNFHENECIYFKTGNIHPLYMKIIKNFI